jgi:eukaryotic-like serine/threonine-protein kinase
MYRAARDSALVTSFWAGERPTVEASWPRADDGADPVAPEPGELLDGVYRVVKTLGLGGMGIVVLARDERLERDVALKLIHSRLLGSQGVDARFLAEARAMARIRHENVVSVYAFGQVHGVPYFVMEYVPGTDLGCVLDSKDGGLPTDEAIRILRPICRAIDAIHSAGTIHRDLKPSNVLIGRGQRVVVTDLGLARLMDRPASESEHGLVAGTPDYLAPEVLRGEEPTPASDVYALGVMAYELFTGRLPFEAESVEDVFNMHLNEPPPLPSSFRPTLPAALDDALLAALEKQPQRRPASGMALLREVVAAHEDAMVPASSVRILIADDDAEMQLYSAAVLEEAFPGAEIECVGDGGQALSSLERHPVSLVLMDLDMPALNGFELTQAMRARAATKKTPIIVMTAVGGGSEWRKLATLGANAFLVKPFEAGELVSAVRRLLGMPGARDNVG